MSIDLKIILNTCLQKNLNFVAYSLPKTEEFTVIIEHPKSKSNEKSGFIFHPYEISNENPIVFIPKDFEIKSSTISEKIIAQIDALPSNPLPDFQPSVGEISKSNYLKALNKGIETLNRGELNKFIYSRIFSYPTNIDFDVSNYLISLRNSHETAFVYFINHRDCGRWVGATPETLLEWNGSRITTMSLAGTQPNSEKEIIWEQKEIEEQQYVTHYIESKFFDRNIDFISGNTETISAGPVVHLQTKIESKSPVSFSESLEMARLLHPTPAICGVPTRKAKKIIQDLEIHNRRYYTGYLGIIEPEESLQLFVNLRCMQVFPNSLALYVGGGITADSIAEKEWKETQIKAQTLLQVLS